MGKAFNVREISTTIGKIGWSSYIAALIVLVVAMIVVEIVITIPGMIPVLGIIVELVLMAPVVVFEARYLCLVYDIAGAA
jgi:hypothetical protein